MDQKLSEWVRNFKERHRGRRGIVRTAAAQNYAMQAILLGIVKSTPFQMRTTMTDSHPAPATSRAAKE